MRFKKKGAAAAAAAEEGIFNAFFSVTLQTTIWDWINDGLFAAAAAPAAPVGAGGYTVSYT